MRFPGRGNKMQRMDRPKLNPNSNQMDFAAFEKDWQMFCTIAGN
jgi:hypothetical protein